MTDYRVNVTFVLETYMNEDEIEKEIEEILLEKEFKDQIWEFQIRANKEEYSEAKRVIE